MTLLNFPSTDGKPTDGSFTYTANGVIYSWDGEKWEANSESALNTKYVQVAGDTMTGDLTVETKVATGDSSPWTDPTNLSGSLLEAGYLLQYRNITDDSGAFHACYNGNGGSPVFQVKTDGSAEFADTVVSSTSVQVSRSNGTLAVMGGSDTTALWNGAGNYQINHDGSASFANTVQSLSFYGNASSSSAQVFTGAENASTTSYIRADGSANFGTGAIGAASGTDLVQINRGYGQVQVQSNSGGNAIYRGYNSDGTTTFTVRGSGDAEFNGTVTFDVRNYGSAIPAIVARANTLEAVDAPITSYNGNTNGGCVYVGYGPNNNRCWFITNSGSAYSTGLSIGLNADNPANFNAQGEYTGPTLDMKKVGLALVALKAAAAASTDYASLKSAIATALADL